MSTWLDPYFSAGKALLVEFTATDVIQITPDQGAIQEWVFSCTGPVVLEYQKIQPSGYNPEVLNISWLIGYPSELWSAPPGHRRVNVTPFNPIQLTKIGSVVNLSVGAHSVQNIDASQNDVVVGHTFGWTFRLQRFEFHIPKGAVNL